MWFQPLQIAYARPNQFGLAESGWYARLWSVARHVDLPYRQVGAILAIILVEEPRNYVTSFHPEWTTVTLTSGSREGLHQAEASVNAIIERIYNHEITDDIVQIWICANVLGPVSSRIQQPTRPSFYGHPSVLTVCLMLCLEALKSGYLRMKSTIPTVTIWKVDRVQNITLWEDTKANVVKE